MTCDPSVLSQVGEALKNDGYNVDTMEIQMVPKNTVSITNKADAQKLLAMVERFEDHDDVQAVYSNFDIPEEILAEIEE
ncbi:YebC/PmpR family DNA-binding transcriptional regulator [uncultured Cloacibacillus sp.]|uniref:YebC/PmpR family DNA-binding transcriptional regulator n=1 Tax=uncultured Cloacibacillus sp. TaxID=889794 RepID=UPI0032085705